MDNELSVVARHSRHAPVDLVSVFADLGIDYSKGQIRTGESGWIERDGESYIAMVGERESEPRKRFTAAHELAHYLLHRDLMASGGRMNRRTKNLFGDDDETDRSFFKRVHKVQANRLAAQIITPAGLVRREHARALTTAALAHDFRVSRAAMAVRPRTLHLSEH